MTKLIPIVLAGGAGRRLYPISSALLPKQFLQNPGEDCLFQSTMKTVSSLSEDVIVVSSIRYRNNILMMLSNEQRESIKFVFEPCMRNSLAASLLGAMLAAQKYEDPLVLVTPCDLIYEDPGQLKLAINEVLRKFNDNSVTFLTDLKSTHNPEFFGAFICRASKLLSVCSQYNESNFAKIMTSLKHSLVRQNEISINYEDYSSVVDCELSKDFFTGKFNVNNYLLGKSVLDINNIDDFFSHHQENGAVPLNMSLKNVDIKSFNRLSPVYYISEGEQGLFLCRKAEENIEVA